MPVRDEDWMNVDAVDVTDAPVQPPYQQRKRKTGGGRPRHTEPRMHWHLVIRTDLRLGFERLAAYLAGGGSGNMSELAEIALEDFMRRMGYIEYLPGGYERRSAKTRMIRLRLRMRRFHRWADMRTIAIANRRRARNKSAPKSAGT